MSEEGNPREMASSPTDVHVLERRDEDVAQADDLLFV
jgi:hypothetical protein